MATTQRMETPVIYFYANTAQDVSVEVDFPDGLITEWYPEASTFTPQPRHVTELKNGQMIWNTKISTGQEPLMAVSSDEIWQAQRDVDANQISVEGENENFIFYRGIGRFQTPFSTSSDADGRLSLNNDGDVDVPAAILLNFDGNKGAFKVIDHIRSGARLRLAANEIPDAVNGLPTEQYVHAISEALESRLIANGLFPLEAQAMVNTWKRSYFSTPGLRVLYVLPRSWTDSIVPLQLTPAPKALERVFVGRVEIFRVAEEQALLADIRTAIAHQIDVWTFSLDKLGRFAEPKLWRLLSLTSNEAEAAYIRELINRTFQP